jgi:hypothetical protein
MKKLLILFLAIMGIYACNNTSTLTKGAIQPPVAEWARAYTIFEIDPAKENILDLPSGTKITVPANALVDANGTVLTGKVQLKYREYHDATDVLLSGIPMDYEAAGKKHTMQTAGMFDIAAEQNGQAASVKNGSKIKVDFASFEAGTDYNFFKLDEGKGWEFVDYVQPKPNEERIKTEKEIDRLSALLNTKQENYFVCNYEAVLDIEYNNDYYKIQENRENKGLAAKVKRYDLDFFKSRIYNIVTFKGNIYPADMMVWKNRSGKLPNWVRMELCEFNITPISGNLYTIDAKKDDKTFSFKVEAIAPLKYLFEFSPEDWKKNFNKVMQEVSAKEEKLRIELEEARKRWEQQAAVMRSFEIAGFGVYNYDKLMKEDGVEVLANFKMDAAGEALDWVICLPQDGKTVIKYPKADWDKVVLLPNNAARFVTILPNKSVGIYAAKDYQKLDFEKLKGQGGKQNVEFTLVKVVQNVDSEAAIRAALNS